MGGWVRFAALIAAVMVSPGCARSVVGVPAAVPPEGLTARQQLHVDVEDILRTADPCGLLDEGPLEAVGAVAQFGAAVQLSVCSALITRPDGNSISVELSLLPSMLSAQSVSEPTVIDGVTVYRGRADPARGTCERVFRLALGGPAELAAPRLATVRVGAVAGEDACPLADSVLSAAIDRMASGLPSRAAGDRNQAELARHDPCEVLEVLGEDAGTRLVDADALPAPFDCVFYPSRGQVPGSEVTVAFTVRSVGNDRTEVPAEPARIGDRCRWSTPVGAAIDVTRPDAVVDDITRMLGRARGVVTVHGRDCAAVAQVAEAAETAFG
ncbi:MAG: hypothetical protein WAW17_30670 [Rhodococcus sp. (in: high G+C Gram-positive bacteria)]|uniref:hypothetical protein n=1 Tax=Rhodococcus sp. TaxID=1831 RepID=UPI003BAFF6DF